MALTPEDIELHKALLRSYESEQTAARIRQQQSTEDLRNIANGILTQRKILREAGVDIEAERSGCRGGV